MSLAAPARTASDSALAPTYDYTGWMLKSAPRAPDCDKADTLQRRLGKLVRLSMGGRMCVCGASGGPVTRRVALCCACVHQVNLVKRKVSKGGDFKRRFFVLDHHDLRYYSDATQAG
jgi:hypothetical protein